MNTELANRGWTDGTRGLYASWPVDMGNLRTVYGATRPLRKRISPLPDAVSAALTILVGRDLTSERESITFFTAFKACARVILPVFSSPLMILVSIFRFAMKHFYHDAVILSTAANQYNSQTHSSQPQLSTPPTIMSRASRVNRPRAEVSGAPG